MRDLELGIKTFYDEVSSFAKGDGTLDLIPFIPKMISDIAAWYDFQIWIPWAKLHYGICLCLII